MTTTSSAADGAGVTARIEDLWSRWPGWTRWFAGTVIAGYTAVAAAWFAGGPYPFARPANPDSTFGDHWLAAVPPRAVEAVTLGAGVLVLLALWGMRPSGTGRARPVWLAIGGSAAFFLTLVLPGAQSLDVIPVLNLLNLKRLAWPTVHLVLLAYTGLALAGATLSYARRTAARCENCGRGARRTWSRDRWRRIGVASAVAAAVAPVGYAAVRLCWVAGIPVGTTQAFLDRINAANPGHETLILEVAMSAMAIGGGVLCFGLTRRWSQVFPRWLPGLAHRPVPHWFPVGMGTICGVGLCGFSTLLLPDLLRFASGRTVYYAGTSVETVWLSHIPAMSLFVWSVMVLLSTAAFHYRTRPVCRHCHRG